MNTVDAPPLAAPERSRANREYLFLLTTFAVALLGSIGGVFWMARSRPAQAEPERLPIPAEEVIGRKPSLAGTFTLVEFMDYQCPPCRRSASIVEGLVKRNNGKVELVVRHLPLRIHNRAETAAAAAEAGRRQGKFAEIHKHLLDAEDLSDAAILKIARTTGLNVAAFKRSWQGAAKERVSSDKKAAAQMGIDSTPTFLLCTPQGEVWRLASPMQAQRFVTPLGAK